MSKSMAMRDSLLREIFQAMQQDRDIFFVTADFGSPILDKIREEFPDRFVNVGIAEQNLINISSGLSLEGYTVFTYAIAPFITMRCFEQLRVNLALLSEVRTLNVNLIGVGAGYSYVVSGPTHQCYEDLSLIRSLPNFEIYSPSDSATSAGLISYCLSKNGPKYIRLDAQVLPDLRQDLSENVYKSGFERLLDGDDGLFISTGYMTHTALEVAKLLRPSNHFGVIDIFNLTSFDCNSLIQEIKGTERIVTLEEGFQKRGGLDAMIAEFMEQNDLSIRCTGIGVRPGYSFELGERSQLHELVGIGKQAIFDKVNKLLDKDRV